MAIQTWAGTGAQPEKDLWKRSELGARCAPCSPCSPRPPVYEGACPGAGGPPPTLQHLARRPKEGASPDSAHQLLPAPGGRAAAAGRDQGSVAHGSSPMARSVNKSGAPCGFLAKGTATPGSRIQTAEAHEAGSRSCARTHARSPGHPAARTFIVCAPAGCQALGAPPPASRGSKTQGATAPANLRLPALVCWAP